jgi:hypothetical protein
MIQRKGTPSGEKSILKRKDKGKVQKIYNKK